MALAVKNPPASAGDPGSNLSRDDPLEEGMAVHSGVLSWRTPWTEEPSRLQLWGCKGSDMTKATSATCTKIKVFDFLQ